MPSVRDLVHRRSRDAFRSVARISDSSPDAALADIYRSASLRIADARIASRATGGGGGPVPILPPPTTGTGSEGMNGSPIVPSGFNDVIPGISGGGLPGVGGSGLKLPGIVGTVQTIIQQDPLGLAGECPGLFNVKIGGRCVDVTNSAPGGDPMITGQTQTTGAASGNGKQFGGVTMGRYGEGIIPRVDVRPIRSCPAKYVLGDDGVCYKRLPRRDRAWDPGVKPLLTGGERRAISRAAAAGRKLDRAKKQLKKAGRALEKAC